MPTAVTARQVRDRQSRRPVVSNAAMQHGTQPCVRGNPHSRDTLHARND